MIMEALLNSPSQKAKYLPSNSIGKVRIGVAGMVKILLAGVALLAIFGTASAQEGPPLPLGWVYSKYVDCPDGHPGHGCYIKVRTGNDANVRQYPNGPVLLSLAPGTRVRYYNYKDHWVQVAVEWGEEPPGFFREEPVPQYVSPEDLPTVDK
jgi:hypothetical protein